MPEMLPISDIVIDESCQPRVDGLDDKHIAELVDAIENECEIPHLVVWNINGKYKLSSGFHRYAAYKKCGHAVVPCEIKQGTETDWRIDALVSNVNHGLKLKPADKKFAASEMMRLLPDLPNREVARRLNISEKTVRNAKKQDEPLSPPKPSTKAPTNEVRTVRTEQDDTIDDDIEDVEYVEREPAPARQTSEPKPTVLPRLPQTYEPQLDPAYMPNADDARTITDIMGVWESELKHILDDMRVMIPDGHTIDNRIELRGTITNDLRGIIETLKTNKPTKPCPHCCGTGETEDGDDCKHCGGYGIIDEKTFNDRKEQVKKSAKRWDALKAQFKSEQVF